MRRSYLSAALFSRIRRDDPETGRLQRRLKLAQFKRGKRGALAVVFSVAACAALVFGVTQSFAGGKSAVAPIRYDRDACSTPSNNKVIGKASFTRSGNTVTLKVQLHGADPGDYYLYLYFNSCSDSGYYAKFKVDASGEGSDLDGDCSFYREVLLRRRIQQHNGHRQRVGLRSALTRALGWGCAARL